MTRRLLSRMRRVDDAALTAYRRVRGAETPWHGIADIVTARPWHVLLVALILLLVPLAALPGLRLSHNELAELPEHAESVQGFREVAGHIPPGELSPVILVIDGDTEVWEPEALLALGLVSRNLKRLDQVSSVRSAAMPTDGEPPSEVASDEATQEFADLTSRLEEAAFGARRLEDGTREVRNGLREITERLPELESGLDAATGGADRLRAGMSEALDGVSELQTGAGQLDDGLAELRSGLVDARDGAVRLRDEVAAPAEESIRAGYDALVAMTVGRTDPMYEEARREFGDAYARITGEYPPGHPQAGQQVSDDYEGLPEAMDELAAGLDEAVSGVDRLRDGLGRLDAGLAELEDGLGQLHDGLERLGGGLSDAHDGVLRLQDGIQRMLTGVDDRLLPGASRLADGLTQGVAQIERANLDALLPTGGPGEFIITPGILELRPEVREQLDLFVAEDATLTRMFVGLEGAPYERDSIEAIERIRDVARLSLADSPLDDARVLPTGTSAFFSDVDDVSSRDFRLIMIAVIVGVYLVLALLLRALVAPLYMVASVLLSFGVALGLTTFVFQDVFGRPGIAWYIPPMLFVLLVALGVDYNIFLMSRVREEADRRPNTAAVATGLRLTGGVITSAGLILAGTFAALMVAPLESLAQIGFAVSVGILLDTFIVRSFVVPSIAVLLGPWNWWPSSRGRGSDAAAARTRQ